MWEEPVRSLILSLLSGIACAVFFDTALTKRRWKYKWMAHTAFLAFSCGYLLISVLPAPDYIYQPLRLIAVVFLVVQLYYSTGWKQNMVLSVLYCALLWILIIFVLAGLSALPSGKEAMGLFDEIWSSIWLCLVLVFCLVLKKRKGLLADSGWIRFGFFPAASIVIFAVLGAVSWENELIDSRLRLGVVAGFGILNLLVFYFIADILKKEKNIRSMELLKERTQNQMSIYKSMQKSYEQQKQFLHDYKNQLNCIQGLLTENKTKEALAYIEGLNGTLKKNADFVNTNHTVVNVVLNQKYKYAQDEGITVTMSVNDLSGLTISEEDIVVLLVNLLDNAIEACKKLKTGRLIQFKMTMEEEQLILSVKNPVAGPVLIKNKTIVTTKEKKEEHGAGLLNIDSVIRKNGGTSSLKCEAGWFYFSAMIPLADRK